MANKEEATAKAKVSVAIMAVVDMRVNKAVDMTASKEEATAAVKAKASVVIMAAAAMNNRYHERDKMSVSFLTCDVGRRRRRV
jgi:hypothetical protein